MKLNLVFPCPQSVSIPFSIPFPLISVFPAKCMWHPQNDTMPHSLGSKTTVEMKEHLEKQNFKACFCYQHYFFCITVHHLFLLT